MSQAKTPRLIGVIWEDGDLPTRSVYLLELDGLSEWPTDLRLSSPRFGLFLACDASPYSDDAIRRLGARSYDQGMCFLDAWGSHSDRVHFEFDRAVLERFPEETDESVILTSESRDEMLDGALYTFLFTSTPAAAYNETCSSWLVCCVGSSETADQLRLSLGDPQALHDRVLDRFIAANPHLFTDDEKEERGWIEFTPAERLPRS